MKLLTKYNYLTFILVIISLLMSAFILYTTINKIFVAELDEVLIEIKDKALNYSTTKGALPVNGTQDDYIISTLKIAIPVKGFTFKTISKYSTEKKHLKHFRQIKFGLQIQSQPYIVTIEKPVEGIRDLSQSLIKLTIVTIFLVILILSVLNSLILKQLWNPFYNTLKRLQDFKVTNAIPLHIEKSNIEEFDDMNQVIIKMTQKAGKDYLALKEFTENASHELQTPLAIIQSKLELLIQDEQLSENQHNKIRSAFTAVKKLIQLNQTLLLSAKIGNDQFHTKTKILLKDKIAEKMQQFEELWDPLLTIKVDLSETILYINPELCDVLINNLLNNATRYNSVNGEIKIELHQGMLRISNTGIETALDEKNLFKRFYKQNLSSAGNGLGLAIVKQICDAYNIIITYHFENNLHQFTLTWKETI